ncbi:MAG: YggS family pyridoxal phosphate-dependent enzyme [Bacteroidota bacterium]
MPDTAVYYSIVNALPPHVTLVAVSKTKSVSDIMAVYACGQRTFGENKVQELTEKYEQLPKDIAWHLIGHLQTNKVKYIAPFVALIHAVDSLKLLQEINKQALKNNRTINCLLQIYIAKEETKFGLDQEEAENLIFSPIMTELTHIKICGLMGMATNTNDTSVITQEFKQLKDFFDSLKQRKLPANCDFTILSMGMSSDYQTAITCGSNMIRIGSSIFGGR